MIDWQECVVLIREYLPFHENIYRFWGKLYWAISNDCIKKESMNFWLIDEFSISKCNKNREFQFIIQSTAATIYTFVGYLSDFQFRKTANVKYSLQSSAYTP